MISNGRRAALAALAGATLALGAPPLEFWPSTFVAIALFALSVDGATARRGLLSGWIFGTCATLGAFYWVVGTVTRFTDLGLPVALLAYVLMSAAAGLTLGTAGLLAGLTGRIIGYPLALGLGVFVAERYVPGVFPWQMAAPLIFAPWVRQTADLVGVSGLGALLAGALMVLARALLAWWRARRAGAPPDACVPRRQWVAALAVVAFAWVYGAARTAHVLAVMARAPRVRVALVQPNIAPTVRWDPAEHEGILRNLHEQSRAGINERADLIVWSEAAYPFPLPHRPSADAMFGPPIYPGAIPVPMLIGALTIDDADHQYNSAVVREPGGALDQPVSKQVLVPFGEYLPVVGEIAWVRQHFARASGLARGTGAPLAHTDSGLELGVLNCFEDTVAWLGARVSHADLLVNITNDAWFGEGPAAWQHLMLARWRAIETRRELVRAVNTGVTCHVDALGRIARHAPVWQRATLIAEPHRLAMQPLAPYAIAFGPLAAALALALALAERVRRRLVERGKVPPHPPAAVTEPPPPDAPPPDAPPTVTAEGESGATEPPREPPS